MVAAVTALSLRVRSVRTFNTRRQHAKDLLTPQGLAEVKTYADGVGPWKVYLMSKPGKGLAGSGCADTSGNGIVDERDRALLAPSAIVANAHAIGLLVHPYAFGCICSSTTRITRAARSIAGTAIES